MKVIANENVTLLATTHGRTDELNILKGTVYYVTWNDETPEQKSFIYIEYVQDSRDMQCSKMIKYKVEMTREQFEDCFGPIENNTKLHFHRIDLSTEVSNTDRCNKVNNFIQDTNIKIEKIFEPDSETVDIWYTKYVGDW